jgi:hypothetical protein
VSSSLKHGIWITSLTGRRSEIVLADVLADIAG